MPPNSESRKQTGLPVVSEILDTRDIELFLEKADIIQVGARNMQNFALLKALGRTSKPVLLKRGLSATIEDLLMSAEYILAGGNHEVILCERGIRTFEAHTRFTLPLATIAYLHERTHLPVIIDPSHGTGIASLVPSMSAAAVAAGADGLIIEVHPDPRKAMSDGSQTLTPEAFAATIATCRRVADALGYVLS